MAEQLPLDLPHQASLARADFLIGDSNREAVAIVDAWPDWSLKTLLFAGPAGSGKSHLVEIWRAESHAIVVGANELRGDSEVDLLATGAVAVEDLHRADFDERAMFHLLNRANELGAFVVLTTRVWPASLPLSVPDLRSRLTAARPVEIGEPDDALLRNVLAKLFADRQLEVTPAVVEFILRRMERSLEAARLIVSDLDRRALAQSRAVTRPLAAAVLAEISEGSSPDADRQRGAAK